MSDKKTTEERNIYKVVMKGNKKENTVSVTFQPELVSTKVTDSQTLLNVLTSGTHAGFVKLLGGLPILRPATETERESKVYVFVDDHDTRVHKMRKDLYGQLQAVFGNILTQLFPDVEYIEACNTYQQEVAFEMYETEAAEYKKEIETVVEKVKAELLEKKEVA